MTIPKPASAVAAVLKSYPPQARKQARALRRLIFETAAEIGSVGELTETLKWGEPAYLTEQTRSGSTVRLGWRSCCPDDVALFFICRTNLVSDFRAMFGDALRFEGDRAILLGLSEPLPEGPLKVCIGAALTYHSGKSGDPLAGPA